jgi:hypothetical protein
VVTIRIERLLGPGSAFSQAKPPEHRFANRGERQHEQA